MRCTQERLKETARQRKRKRAAAPGLVFTFAAISAISKMDVSSAIPAGEAFVTSFSDMTRLMVGQSRALARKVSLAQLLDDGDSSNRNNDNSNGTNISSKDNKENSLSNNSSSSRAATNTNTKHSGLSEQSNTGSNNNGAAVLVGTNKARAKVVQDLRSLDAIVLDLERRAASMRDAIDRQRRGNEAFRELSEATRQQTAQLAAACAALPEHLPHDGPTATAAVAVASSARAGSDAERREPPSSAAPAAATAAVGAVGARTTAVAGAEAEAAEAAAVATAGHNDGHASRVAASSVPVVPVLELVTVGELEGVPRSTRSRLTIAHINAAVTEIQKAMERR